MKNESILSAGLLCLLVSGLFIGCETSDIIMPSTTASIKSPINTTSSAHTTVPTTSAGTILPVSTPEPEKTFVMHQETCYKEFRNDLFAASAQERASENGWVCLNEYIATIVKGWEALYDSDFYTGNEEGLQWAYCSFDRPVEVWAAEFVVRSNVIPYDSYFELYGSDIAYTRINYFEANEEISRVAGEYESPCCYDYVLPNHTVWVERINGDRIEKGYLSVGCGNEVFGVQPALVEIRIYGKVIE